MTLLEDVDRLAEAIAAVGANAQAHPLGEQVVGSPNLAGDLRAYLEGLVAA